MMNPKMIIELRDTLSKEETQLVEKFLLNMTDVRSVEIYEANDYAFGSDFADTITEQINITNAQDAMQ